MAPGDPAAPSPRPDLAGKLTPAALAERIREIGDYRLAGASDMAAALTTVLVDEITARIDDGAGP